MPPTPHFVNHETGVIDGLVKQVLYGDRKQRLELTQVWVCNILPTDSKAIVSIIKEKMPEDELDLHHLKRFVKCDDDESGKVILKAVLCSDRCISTKEKLLPYLGAIRPLSLYKVDVPKVAPTSKELMLKWREVWPLIWKGNPNIQFLNQVRFDFKQERETLQVLYDKLQEQVKQNELPFVTIITEPTNNKIMAISKDARSTHPLHHSIIEAIQCIATNEQQKRKDYPGESHNYLCLNYNVYTTYEPCIMCCMALVHSRVKKLIYLKSNANGGIESNYGIHSHSDLNWNFEAWKWVGEEFNIEELDKFDNLNV